METILWIAVLLGVFFVGYFVVNKIDSFLEQPPKKGEDEFKEPTYIVIPGDKSLMEIDSQIADFKEKHSDMQIILCDKSAFENKDVL